MSGPVPRREEELARPRERKGGDQVPVTHGQMRPITWNVPADENWHPIAKMLYESVVSSGQSDFYQDSDYAMLYSICEDLSVYKNAGKRSGQLLQSIMSALTSLLLTEGERRRVRIELQKPPEKKPDLKVLAMDRYRGIDEG